MNLKNIKSNQIILFVVALMLVSAGYLSYSMRGTPVSSNIVSENEVSSIGDAQLVSSNNIIDSNSLNEMSVATSSNSSSRIDDYFASSRLGRDTMYSQMIETYEKVLNSDNSLETQKQSATDEIKKINDTKRVPFIFFHRFSSSYWSFSLSSLRIKALFIFPPIVFGSSSTNSITRGYL